MTKLTDIRHLEYLNTYKVETMEGMFYKCEALTTLNLSSFDVRNLNVTNHMFSGCKALKTIYCNDDWNIKAKLTDSQSMFSGCISLVGGNGTKYDDAYPKDKTYAHLDESGTPGYFTTKGKNEIYATLSPDKTTMTLFYDDQRSTRGGATDWSGFKSDVTTVVLDESMQDARPESTKSWFDTFNSLTEIQHLDYLNTSNVTNMNFMFWDCAALKSIDLSHFDTKNVTNMWGMFYGCTTLTSLDLSGFNTEKVTSMRGMFANSAALTSLDLSSFDTKSVTDMFQMFNSCTALKTIICADNADWNQSTVTASGDMFYGCIELVGEKGTKYDVNHTGITYAHPDEPGNPGYFTKKTATGIETITNDQSNKIIKDNQLLILRGDKTYTITGAEVK
jgi:surface protein